jgi:hypothetical protein
VGSLELLMHLLLLSMDLLLLDLTNQLLLTCVRLSQSVTLCVSLPFPSLCSQQPQSVGIDVSSPRASAKAKEGRREGGRNTIRRASVGHASMGNAIEGRREELFRESQREACQRGARPGFG